MKLSTTVNIYLIFKTIRHLSAKWYLIPLFYYNFYLPKFATLKFDMEDNDILINKLNQNPFIRPQKCRNTQSGSLQNHSGQNLKNYNIANSDESLNLAKKQQDYFLIPERTNLARVANLHGIKVAAVQQKKQPKSQTNNFYSHEAKSPIQNLENCKNENASSYKKQIFLDNLKTGGLRNPSNKSYNNLWHYQISNQINFIQRQRQNQKTSKKFISKPPQISGQRLIQSLQKHRMSMFVKDGEIIFPIPDHILKLTQNEQSSTDSIKNIKPHLLPKGFCYLLEMMNISYLFPQLFKFDQETIFKISHILQAPLQQRNPQQNQINKEKSLNLILEEVFKAYIKTTVSFMIEDLNSDKLQSLGPSQTYDILSLAKFCKQNQLLEFVYRYNWPLITLELVNLSTEQPYVTQFQRSKSQNTQFTKSMQFIKNCILNGNFEMPQNLEVRLELISLFIDNFSKSNSFRELFNKKLEANRNFNKKRMELEQEKKNIEQAIKKINALKMKKTKKITKSEKKKDRPIGLVSDNFAYDNEEKDQKNWEQLQKLQKHLDQINYQIQKQNGQDSLSCVHFLGKDSNGHLYWYVSPFPDKLYIQKENQNWSFLCADQTLNFIDSLDRKGINQNCLYERIQQYYRHPFHKHQSKMEIETEQNYVNQKPGSSSFQIYPANLLEKISLTIQNCQMHLQKIEAHEQEHERDSSKNSSDNNELLIGIGGFKIDKDSLIRMVEVGEKKMAEYLKDRNSRWGSEQNRQSLFATIKSSQLNWLQQTKRQLSLFNQKICVVEIQYKVFVQQSVEQVDSKIKKIQTKIWGINQKYKHNWYEFIDSCKNFTELFFAVSVLYSLIKKYTSKHRKLRKEFEQIRQKTVRKMTSAVKQWKQNWNQICQVCGQNGQLLCCDFCPKVYHLDCLNLSQIPQQQYKCKSCKQQITTRNQFKNLTNEGKKQGQR